MASVLVVPEAICSPFGLGFGGTVAKWGDGGTAKGATEARKRTQPGRNRGGVTVVRRRAQRRRDGGATEAATRAGRWHDGGGISFLFACCSVAEQDRRR